MLRIGVFQEVDIGVAQFQCGLVNVDIWKSVVNGYRPDTTPYGYSYRHGGIPYVANSYHKRAIDNAISSQIIQKYTAEFMQNFL